VKLYFSQVNNLSRAVNDLTRAIHMKPDAYDLHIMRLFGHTGCLVNFACPWFLYYFSWVCMVLRRLKIVFYWWILVI